MLPRRRFHFGGSLGFTLSAPVTFLFLLSALHVHHINGRFSFSKLGLSRKKGFLYLGANDSFPVLEFDSIGEKDPVHPDFLYSPSTGNRVVEFYAPWCGHCQNFRANYIAYAQGVTDAQEAAKVDEASRLSFHAISCTNHNQICRDFKIEAYPRIKVFRAGSSEPTADIYPKLPQPIELMVLAGVKNLDPILFGEIPKEEDKKTSEEVALLIRQKMAYYRRKRSTFTDAHRSFDYAMRNGLFTDAGKLTTEKTQILRQWLEILAKVLPSSWEVREISRAVLDDLDNLVQGKENITTILDRFPEPPTEWSPFCSKRQASVGYLCGLWKLLHITTIGALESNGSLEPDSKEIVTPDSAGIILRNFVKEISGCQECQDFIKAYDTCELNRCKRFSSENHQHEQRDFKQVPLWLFEIHNKISADRREKSHPRDSDHAASAGKDVEDQRWPLATQCLKCRKRDGMFDEEMMLKYLRVEYWPEDEKTDSYRKEVGVQLDEVDVANTSADPSFSVASVVTGISTLAVFCWYCRDKRRGKVGMPHSE